MLTKHFSEQEFRRKCGKCDAMEPDLALLVILEAVRREFLDAPVTINSGVRCPAHNARIKDSPNSQHLHGRAADIVVEDATPAEIADWLDRQPWADRIGLGRYETFTHVDTRGTRARWTG